MPEKQSGRGIVWWLGLFGIGCMGLCAALVIGAGWLGMRINQVTEENEAKRAAAVKRIKTTPVSAFTFEEADAIVSDESATDIQKREAWQPHVGKKIRWAGEVDSISESFGSLNLRVKHKPDTYIGNVSVDLMPDQKASAMKFQKGDSITYTGILGDLGPVVSGIEVKWGVIERW